MGAGAAPVLERDRLIGGREGVLRLPPSAGAGASCSGALPATVSRPDTVLAGRLLLPPPGGAIFVPIAGAWTGEGGGATDTGAGAGVGVGAGDSARPAGSAVSSSILLTAASRAPLRSPPSSAPRVFCLEAAVSVFVARADGLPQRTHRRSQANSRQTPDRRVDTNWGVHESRGGRLGITA